MVAKVLALLILFAEPGFPAVDVQLPLPLGDLEGATVVTSVTELEAVLQPGRVLVWRHGSAFPAEAWPALVRFLENGGSMLYLGGEPFTRPVTGGPGSRVVQPRTVSLLKELRLNRSYRVEVGGASHRYHDIVRPIPPEQTLAGGAWVSILEPRLSDEKEYPEEDGSAGPRDGIVRPLSHLYMPDEDPRFPCAAGSVAIDRLRGRFSGGRWVFRLLSTPPGTEELEYLIEEAARPAVDFRVDPVYGCFHQGETPAVRVSIHRPGADDIVEYPVTLDVTGPDGRTRSFRDNRLRAGERDSIEVQLRLRERPGLYTVTAHAVGLDPVTTGFWIFDDELFTSGDELTFDNYTLLRNGMPEPVIGTTVMSFTVHRNFLFEPNAAVWDETFAELASLDINLVRMGVWTGFQRVTPEPEIVDEAWLRALEAYYLSARRHGIPVIFTFFAFVPGDYGGISPYFDPRSIEGQQAYISSVVSRFATTKEMMWDLINEPSFASPRKLWRCRPNGDVFEETAFLDWLRLQYAEDPGDPEDTSWQDMVRARWRLFPDEEIGLPRDSDFSDYYYLSDHRPYRAMDYIRFAQDAFENWIVEMTEAIRAAGSDASITVGQDEGGLVERPSPLFHHRSVDYTSMHTWWNNDALLWDGLMAKAPGKPLLISETGIMQREDLSGESLRPLEGYADLLSRKIGYTFAAGAFGMVEWIYDVNPYMPSDNEVAIGLRRPDGSYKPEHRVLREFAAFISRNKRFFTGLPEPEITVVVPFGDMFGPRDLQTAGTRLLTEGHAGLGDRRIQFISEYRTASDLGQPRLIILPANRGISENAWKGITGAVEEGALLLCSGWFEADDASLPAVRVGAERRELSRFEIGESTESEVVPILRYPLAAVESGYAATHGKTPLEIPLGSGSIRHYAYPLEWAQLDHYDNIHSLYYNLAGNKAGVPIGRFNVSAWIGLGAYYLDFRDATLVIAVNESGEEQTVRIGPWRDPTFEATVPPGVTRMFLLDTDGKIIDSSH